MCENSQTGWSIWQPCSPFWLKRSREKCCVTKTSESRQIRSRHIKDILSPKKNCAMVRLFRLEFQSTSNLRHNLRNINFKHRFPSHCTMQARFAYSLSLLLHLHNISKSECLRYLISQCCCFFFIKLYIARAHHKHDYWCIMCLLMMLWTESYSYCRIMHLREQYSAFII